MVKGMHHTLLSTASGPWDLPATIGKSSSSFLEPTVPVGLGWPQMFAWGFRCLLKACFRRRGRKGWAEMPRTPACWYKTSTKTDQPQTPHVLSPACIPIMRVKSQMFVRTLGSLIAGTAVGVLIRALNEPPSPLPGVCLLFSALTYGAAVWTWTRLLGKQLCEKSLRAAS